MPSALIDRPKRIGTDSSKLRLDIAEQDYANHGINFQI